MNKYVGFGLWSFLNFKKSDGSIDWWAYEDYFRQIGNAGGNINRQLAYSVWGISRIEDGFFPYEIVNGKFDLTKFNPVYFETMRKVFAIQIKYGITPVLELFDNCQLGAKESRFSPWRNNVQGVQSFYEAKADQFSKLWIEKCIAEFPGIEFGQCNEGKEGIVRLAAEVINPVLKAHGIMPFCYGSTFKPPFDFRLYAPGQAIAKRFGLKGEYLKSDAEKIKATPEWYDSLKQSEKTVIDALAKSTDNSILHELKKGAELFWKSAADTKIFKMSHGCTNVDDGQFIMMVKLKSDEAHGISDDGVFNGKSLCDRNVSDKVYARPSADEWKQMVIELLKKNKGQDILVEKTPENGQNLACQVATIKAISEVAGSSNLGKYPNPVPQQVEPDPVVTEPETEPEQEPEQKKPFEIDFKKFWNNNKRYVIGGAFIIFITFLIIVLKGC